MRFTALLLTLASLFSSAYAQPTPANVVCYQTIVGSSASYADVSASLDAWQLQMYNTLGLSGPLELQVGHAQVPDRVGFENGCDGPFATVADLFVHIQATSATYDAISDSLEAYIASHPVTSLSTISCAARSIVDELPTCGKVPDTGNAPPQDEPTPDNVVCFQEIVGSLTGTYTQVSAALDAWELKMYNALSLTGPIELQVGHAQVPDRVSFENGCDGPFATVADLFVHIQTTADNYDTVSAALEVFIAANPLPSSSPISCSARSVVTFLPRCGKAEVATSAPAVTQAPVVTEAPTAAPTQAPATQAPATQAPATQAPATAAPTTPVAPANPQQPEESTPADVVCYQEVVGSLTGTYAQVSAALDAWEQKMYAALGLTGALELSVGHAQVPDRNSFENGCEGPYTAVADLFVHIQTTNANYDAVSAALEVFIAANPLTGSAFAPISCSARSVVTYLPTCGKTSTPTGLAPGQPEEPTPADVVCFQEVVGSLTGTYAQVSADLDDWQQKMYVALGLTGPIELQVGHAQIPDRINFENGCDGPYATMADLFVHIQTTNANYDAVSAALEVFIASHPLTAYASIDCSARSVVTYLPTCGKTSTPTGAAPPQQNDVASLCFQEVVGSLSGTYTQVSATLDAWQLKMYTELGLTGPLELAVGHAQIPDRINFENGCDGPYATMADLFVHIPTTFGEYDALSAKLEAFIAANPFTSLSPISCSARSNVAELPSCGKVPNPPVDIPSTPTSTPTTPTGNAPGQPGAGSARSCPVTTYTSSISESAASVTAGKRLYTITYDLANGDADIQFIDVHITTASGFYNARMTLSPSASPAQPSYEFVFPEYLALGQGESVSWWFTTAINIPEQPNIWACDSASTSFQTPGTPVGNNPTSAPVASGPCPAIAFNNAIVRTGAGETTGTGAYAITFANASPDRTVEWVDVHLTANGGQFNYRMDLSPDATPTSVSFITNLPSPYLNLAPGAQVSYWFTYSSQDTACDSSTFAFTATATA